MYICTYNARSLLSDERLLEFKQSISTIKYDIIGLSEIRRTGYNIEESKDHIFCYFGKTKGQYGVGFLIKKHLKNYIESFTAINERICILHLKFENTNLSIVQVYAPTCDAAELEIKEFYDQIQKSLNHCSKNLIIMGDFNARVGQKMKGEDKILGNSCFGKRDQRGETLLQFCWENNFFVINSLFKKKHKNIWTWLSPYKNKSQIDYILSNLKNKITNVEVISNLSFPSDHRLVRSTLLLTNTKKSRATYKSNTSSLKTKYEQEKYIEALELNISNTKLEENDDVETYYEKIKQAIDKSLKSIRHINTNTKRHCIISDRSKSLIKRRNELINKKQLTLEEKNERCYLFKNIHKFIRKEYQDYRLTTIEKYLKKSGSLKKSFKELTTSKKWIPCLKKNSTCNKETFSRSGIVKAATEFYKDLYACKIPSSIETLLPLQENDTILQRFSAQEIFTKIKSLKNEKSSGPDGITNEAISTGKALLVQPLTTLFNKILDDRKIPTEWAKSDIVLLYKKGNPTDISNYRPISLQSNLYKLLASCLEKRLAIYTEEHQPVEQAGFRSTYSTIDHIHSLELIIEKYEEMKRPLYLAFIDYAKAFDSISHISMWRALQECDVPSETIMLIQDIYKKSTSRVILDKTGTEIDICRGVRQGDPLSPRIFVTVLQNIMKKLKWKNKGIDIKGQFLSNLRFADDIILFAENPSQLESMINELNYISNEIGLELNTTKTKIMTNSIKAPIHINSVLLEYVQEYTYLGKQISFKKSRHQDELMRRVNMAWNKFWSLKEILKSNISMKLKKIVLDSCILPSLTYASQTWIFNKQTRNKIITTQRSMERSILNLKLRHKKRSTEIRKATKLIDALEHCKRLKWKWAGHIARMNEDRWAKKISSWKGPAGKRTRGRPAERWLDEILKTAGKDWIDKASDRNMWRKMEEAFTL